ncbi:MAG: DUF1638 domain-containing protein [Methanomassiliicoccaceae archaeon]|nr:DUF1638 domain-containing protein [Methanomassiliicoccaceae archaeon]
MRIGIVACNVLKGEIEFLTKGDPDFVHREYLEFALHEDSENMKRIITEKVNELHGKVDAVLLGYAVCQSLKDIPSELKVPTVMLPGADCIDALLGTEEYNKEKKKCIGTWFSTPGWAAEGVDGLIKAFHLDSAEGYEPQFFLDMMFESYEKCLHIDTGIGNDEEYTKMSKDLADRLKLRLECRSCDGLKVIKDAIADVKKICC